MGTWENGIYDYDHLKRSFLPSYTRYWDEASQVPFLFNPSTGIWISYDDLQSIGLKNEYIKREQLGGGMYWELSADRNAELLGSTWAALTNGQTPSPVTNPPTAPTGATGTSTASPGQSSTSGAPPGDIQPWQSDIPYAVGDRVLYEGKIYRCLQSHTSLSGWTPAAVAALWQLVN